MRSLPKWRSSESHISLAFTALLKLRISDFFSFFFLVVHTFQLPPIPKKPRKLEVVISSCFLGERRYGIAFGSQIANDHSAMNTNWKRPGMSTYPIPYGNRTRVFDMKRRCPNHWTKGTKRPFFIYLSGENRFGSFSFYTILKISFVFSLQHPFDRKEDLVLPIRKARTKTWIIVKK